MVVSDGRNARVSIGDGDKIVLSAGGVLVFALGPLIHRAEAITHDWGPGERAGAMAAEILSVAGILALVDQAHSMSDFMGSDPGYEGGAPACFGEGEARGVNRVVKRIQVSDAGGAGGEGLRADDDPDAVSEVAGAGLAQAFDTGILGRDVDIPGREVFGDATEGLLNDGFLGVVESRVGVAAERRGGQRGAATGVPLRTNREMAVEIEVDFARCGRATVKLEGVSERIRRRRSDGSGVRPHLDLHGTGVEGFTLSVEVEVVVVGAGGTESHRGLRGHGVSLDSGFNLRFGDRGCPTPLTKGFGRLGVLRGLIRGHRLGAPRHRSGRGGRRRRCARCIRQQGGDSAERDGRGGDGHGGSGGRE